MVPTLRGEKEGREDSEEAGLVEMPSRTTEKSDAIRISTTQDVSSSQLLGSERLRVGLNLRDLAPM
jgi:hypothetical protein